MSSSAHLNTRFFILILLLVISLTACTPVTATTEGATRASATILNIQEVTKTAEPPPENPTVTPTSLPVSRKTAESQATSGLIILAIKINGFSQLAAYHPVNQALTQITRDGWNHADPAISPDGTKLAYCADESGRWDIFILDLIKGEKTRLTNTTSYACTPT